VGELQSNGRVQSRSLVRSKWAGKPIPGCCPESRGHREESRALREDEREGDRCLWPARWQLSAKPGTIRPMSWLVRTAPDLILGTSLSKAAMGAMDLGGSA